MQASQSNRKRPAPGTSSTFLQHQQSRQQQPAQNSNFADVSDPSQLSDEQFLNWGTSQSNYGSAQIASSITEASNQDGRTNTHNTEIRTTLLPQGQLVRRSHNQELINRPANFMPNGSASWADIGSNAIRPISRAWEGSGGDAELERRAAEAKRDAQSKRIPKQIPPFIQKLSSFLDADANTDLIRWAPDGNSFIVVDEDEFAKTLIPELFKSDKYASFVRQLNMYGFHKKVGLSDNSMRASEKKAKNPSEYYNQYFKRGRPELLWLIQKSKNEPASKKGRRSKVTEGDMDSGDDSKGDGQENINDLEYPRVNTKELVPVPRGELSQLQKEVRELQRAQQHIASVIARLRDDNNQYLRQASTMIAQHERHENSINAILTFLATFYSRSADGNGNVPNMFPSAIPNNTAKGNVVDVVDYDGPSLSPQNFNYRQSRRPLALLPAPGSIDTSNEVDSATPKSFKTQQQQKLPNQSSTIQVYGDEMSTATSLPQSSSKRGHQDLPSVQNRATKDDIMSVINNLNAKTSSNDTQPSMDLSAALRQYEADSGRKPLTAEQTESMLSLMTGNSGSENPSLGKLKDTNDSYLEPLLSNREQLNMLQRLQEEQDSKVQDLADRLQPLSPHGSIPGLSLPSSRNSADLSRDQNKSTFQGFGDSTQFNFDGSFDTSPYLDDNYFGTVFDSSYATNGSFGPNLNFIESQDTPSNLQTSVTGQRNSGDSGDELKFMSRDTELDDYSRKPEDSSAHVTVPEAYRPGRVVGSISNSSGAPSPQIEEVDEMPEDIIQSPRKRVKTDS